MRTPASVVINGGTATRAWSARPRAARVLDSMLTFGLVAVLSCAVLAFGAVDAWAVFALEAAAAVLFLLWTAQQLVERELDLRPHPLYLPVLAFALLVAAQLIFGLTAYRYATTQEALRYVAYGLLFFVAAQNLGRRDNLRRFLTAMAVFGLLLACFGLVQDLTWNGKLYWTWRPQFAAWSYGPYVNHNHWAGLMELLAPLPLALAARRRTPSGQKIVLWFAATLMVCTVFLSGSRGGMFAVTVQVALAAAYVALRGRSGRGLRELVAAGAVALMFLAWVGGPRLAARLETVYQRGGPDAITSDVRLAIAKDSLRMAAQRPLTGWGLGNFTNVYPQFRSFYTSKFVNAAHDDYLQLLTETGLLGFALMIWFVAAMVRAAWRRSRAGGFVAHARQAALLGCAGLLAHSAFDFNLHIPANAALFYVLAALAAAPEVEGERAEPVREPVLVHDAYVM